MKIVILAVVLTLATNCSGSKQSPIPQDSTKEVIHTAIGNSVTNFYLRDSLQKNVWNFNLLFAQSLFIRSSSLELVPDLAKSMSTTKPLEVKVEIKNGALFHDGTPVLCKDVLWSYDDARHSASPYRATFDQIKSWKCQENVFQITLKKPVHALIEKLLTGIRVYPENSYPAHSTNPIGSGPYKLQSINDSESVWIRHEGYQGALRPWAKKIVIHNIPDSRTRLEWLTSKKLDLLLDWPIEMDPFLESKNSELNVMSYPGSNLMALGFSLNSKCFEHLKNRLSVANLVNKHLKEIKEMEPALFFKAISASDSNFSCPDVKLFYPAQSPLSFYGAPILQDLHQSFGISAMAQESSVFFSKLNAGQYDLFVATLPSEQDPVAFYEYLHSSQWPPQKNRFYFKNSEVDATLEKLALSENKEQTLGLIKKIAEITEKEMPFVPLGYVRQKLVSSSNLIVKKSIADHPWLMMIEAVKKSP